MWRFPCAGLWRGAVAAGRSAAQKRAALVRPVPLLRRTVATTPPTFLEDPALPPAARLSLDHLFRDAPVCAVPRLVGDVSEALETWQSGVLSVAPARTKLLLEGALRRWCEAQASLNPRVTPLAIAHMIAHGWVRADALRHNTAFWLHPRLLFEPAMLHWLFYFLARTPDALAFLASLPMCAATAAIAVRYLAYNRGHTPAQVFAFLTQWARTAEHVHLAPRLLPQLCLLLPDDKLHALLTRALAHAVLGRSQDHELWKDAATLTAWLQAALYGLPPETHAFRATLEGELAPLLTAAVDVHATLRAQPRHLPRNVARPAVQNDADSCIQALRTERLAAAVDAFFAVRASVDDLSTPVPPFLQRAVVEMLTTPSVADRMVDRLACERWAQRTFAWDRLLAPAALKTLWGPRLPSEKVYVHAALQRLLPPRATHLRLRLASTFS